VFSPQQDDRRELHPEQDHRLGTGEDVLVPAVSPAVVHMTAVPQFQALTDVELAQLEGAMLEAYRRELGLKLNDRSRLKAVYGAHFFDADRREKLNAICSAVVQLLEVDMAAINMITATTQVQVAASSGVVYKVEPVADSYCQHSVGLERTLSVEDSLRHALVCESRSTTDLGIRSYLGVPLISASGHIIGSLCCWCYEQRKWTPAEVGILASFAAVIMRFEDSD
jgi:GAF domain-containing protein